MYPQRRVGDPAGAVFSFAVHQPGQRAVGSAANFLSYRLTAANSYPGQRS